MAKGNKGRVEFFSSAAQLTAAWGRMGRHRVQKRSQPQQNRAFEWRSSFRFRLYFTFSTSTAHAVEGVCRRHGLVHVHFTPLCALTRMFSQFLVLLLGFPVRPLPARNHNPTTPSARVSERYSSTPQLPMAGAGGEGRVSSFGHLDPHRTSTTP
jgi:hypothetical protein